jgi:hypothetical protein
LQVANDGSLGANVQARVRWQIPLLQIKQVGSITREDLQEVLETMELRCGNNLLCPHMKFSDGTLLRVFSNWACSCLVRRKEIPTESHLVTRYASNPGVRKNHFDPSSCKNSGDHVVLCERCPAKYTWKVVEEPSSIKQRLRPSSPSKYLVLAASRPMSIYTLETAPFSGCFKMEKYEAARMSFMNAIDPASLEVDTSLLLKHLVWCDNQECRNGGRTGASIRGSCSPGATLRGSCKDLSIAAANTATEAGKYQVQIFQLKTTTT